MALNVGADAWWLENNTALERISPSRADSSTAYKDQVYVRSGASPGSPSARRIVGEHVEPRYIGEHHNTRSYDGYQDSYSARVSRERREVHYNGYQASYGAPVSRERREVQPHEVRIIGERDMRSTESHYPVQTQPVAVPTSRETYMPVDNNRVQTPHRERVSRPSSQPRSDSPERVDRHDHALYTENYLQSPQTTQVYVSSPSPQERVVIKEVPVVEYIEKIVKVPEYIEKIVEVPVEKIVERIITQPIRFSIPPSPKLAPQVIYAEPQVIYSEPEIVRAEAIVVRQRDLVYEPQVVYQPQVTHQPQVTYRRQTNPDLSSAQQRKQVSREELYSRADEIFHSINKAPTIASSPNQSKAPSIASSPALGVARDPVPIRRSSIGSPFLMPSYSPNQRSSIGSPSLMPSYSPVSMGQASEARRIFDQVPHLQPAVTPDLVLDAWDKASSQPYAPAYFQSPQRNVAPAPWIPASPPASPKGLSGNGHWSNGSWISPQLSPRAPESNLASYGHH